MNLGASKLLILLLLFAIKGFSQEKTKVIAGDTITYKWTSIVGTSFVNSFSEFEQEAKKSYLQKKNGRGLLLNYKIQCLVNNKFLIATGFRIGYVNNHTSIYFDKEIYNLTWSFSNSESNMFLNISYPLEFGILLAINKKTDFLFYSDININMLIGADVKTSYFWDTENEYYSYGSYSYDEPNNIILLQKEDKSDIQSKLGLEIGIGIKRKKDNGAAYIFTLFAHSSFVNQAQSYYLFYPDNEQYTSKGIINYKSTFVGLNIGYEFRKK